MEKKRIVCVIYWKDASLHGYNQETEETAMTLGLMKGFSVGILVNETDEFITVACDFFPAQSNNHKNTYRGLQTYPKSGIIRVETHEIEEK